DERRDTALDGLEVGRDGRALAADSDLVLAEPLLSRPRELERARLPQRRLVAPRLDAGGERELVEQLGHLARGGSDHLDVAIGRRLELDCPLERLHESVHGGQWRAYVVAAE